MKRINAFEAKVLISALDALCPNLSLDDSETYKLLSKGETDGIYMLESDWDKYDLQQIQSRNMEELVATVALSHSPRMNPYIYSYVKRIVVRPFTYPTFPVFQKIDEELKETRGMIIYKEQVEAVVNLIEGLSPAEREKYRLMIHILNREIEEKRAIAVRRKFCARRALDSYKQAYLKVHYPNQFNAFMQSRESQEATMVSIPNMEKGDLVVVLSRHGYTAQDPSITMVPNIPFPTEEQMIKFLHCLKRLDDNGKPLLVNCNVDDDVSEQEASSHISRWNVADVIAVLTPENETKQIQALTTLYPNRKPYFITQEL